MAINHTVRATAALNVMDASRYYERQRPGLAVQFVERFDECIRGICNAPAIHQFVYRDFRHALMDQFPYAVYYRFDRTEVTIHLVYHTSRSTAGWKRRLRQSP